MRPLSFRRSVGNSWRPYIYLRYHHTCYYWRMNFSSETCRFLSFINIQMLRYFIFASAIFLAQFEKYLFYVWRDKIVYLFRCRFPLIGTVFSILNQSAIRGPECEIGQLRNETKKRKNHSFIPWTYMESCVVPSLSPIGRRCSESTEQREREKEADNWKRVKHACELRIRLVMY